MKRKVTFVFVATFAFYALMAQDRKDTYSDQVWLGYFSSVKLYPRLSLGNDLQARSRNSLPSQYIARTGLVYSITERIFVTGGFAAFFYPQSTNQNLLRNEWRPWEELMITESAGRLKITERIRIEQRFNQVIVKNDPTDDYNYTNRLRFKFDLQYPIINASKEKNVVQLAAGNEVMINTGKSIKYNYFDQNRLYAGINYAVNPFLTFQLQLMYIWQQQSTGYNFDNNKVLRFNIFHVIYAGKRTK